MKPFIKQFLATAFLITFGTFDCYPQNNGLPSQNVNISIPEIALININNSSQVVLSPKVPTEAGEALDFSSAVDNSVWLNYSSVIKPWQWRWITAEITSGNVPEGLRLSVMASNDAGQGSGRVGIPRRRFVRLTNSPRVIIWAIRSCYTGIGEGAGHNLTYRLEEIPGYMFSYANLVNNEVELEITYTISD